MLTLASPVSQMCELCWHLSTDLLKLQVQSTKWQRRSQLERAAKARAAIDRFYTHAQSPFEAEEKAQRGVLGWLRRALLRQK